MAASEGQLHYVVCMQHVTMPERSVKGPRSRIRHCDTAFVPCTPTCRFLHSGDMRFTRRFLEDPLLQTFRGCTAVYLDTTYAAAKYQFPPQEESINYVADTIAQQLTAGEGQGHGKTACGFLMH